MGVACAFARTARTSFEYLSISSLGASFGGAGGPATTTAPGATDDGGGCPGTVTMTLVGGVVQLTMTGRRVSLLMNRRSVKLPSPLASRTSARPCGASATAA
jgi:hypothetical protein